MISCVLESVDEYCRQLPLYIHNLKFYGIT